MGDNVLKPGAPLYLWRSARGGRGDLTTWAMCEFRHDDQEDWMAMRDLATGEKAVQHTHPPLTTPTTDQGTTGSLAKPTEEQSEDSSFEELFTWRWSWRVRAQKKN